MQPIKITLWTMPVSINRAYKTGNRRFYKSREATDAQEAMAWEAKAQYRGKALDGHISLKIALFWPDNRKHDLDNALKPILDSMTGIVYKDDSQIRDLQVSKATDRGNPRCEVVVESLQ